MKWRKTNTYCAKKKKKRKEKEGIKQKSLLK